MPEFNTPSLPTPSLDLPAQPLPDILPSDDSAGTARDSAGEDDPRNERTFYRGNVLRLVRTFLNENGSLAAMFAVVFVNLVGFGIVVPLIPFFALKLNAEAWQVTLMFSTYSLGQFFAEPVCGSLSDRIGRKPILIVSTALSVLFYALLAFSPNIWAAIAVRFLCGLSSSNISAIQGYVSDVSKPEQRATRMSMIGAAFSLGFVIGPAIGGLLAHGQNSENAFRIPLFAAAVLSAVATFGVMLFVKESRKPAAVTGTVATRFDTRQRLRDGMANLLQSVREAAANPVILCVIAATLCYMGAFAGLESTFGLWVKKRYDWGPAQIGVIFLFIGVTAALMQMVFMRPLVRRYGEYKVLAGGLFIFGLSFIAQSVNHYALLITPLVMFGTIGQAVIFSSICAIISLNTSPDRQGAMLGLNMSTGAIARITGPAIAGFFFSVLGPESPLWMGAAMTIPAALLALQAGRWAKKRNPA